MDKQMGESAEIKIDYQPLDAKQLSMVTGIAALLRKGKEISKSVLMNDPICRVLMAKIAKYKLPKFEGSAILFLSVVAKKNPACAGIALIDTMKEYDKRKSEKDDIIIDINFVADFVYPFGFYTEETALALYKEWHYINPDSHPYSKLFC